jgi:hypothetical protein
MDPSVCGAAKGGEAAWHIIEANVLYHSLPGLATCWQAVREGRAALDSLRASTTERNDLSEGVSGQRFRPSPSELARRALALCDHEVMDSRPRGRPLLYTAELAEEICARMVSGESLRHICKDEHMPGESTVRLWALDDHQGFNAQYVKSRALGIDAQMEAALEKASNLDVTAGPAVVVAARLA